MRCEVCGRKIHNSPIRAVIEGAKLTVCIECSKHGKIISEEELTLEQRTPKTQSPLLIKAQKKKTGEAKVEITQEVVEDYDSKIRQAREKLGLSHEELGKKISEKESVLRKIETRKMAPNKLLVPISEEKIPQTPKSPKRELTLGDLMQLNKKVGEEPTERKPS